MFRSKLENMIIIGIVVFSILLFIVNIMLFVFISGEEPSVGTAKALAVMFVLAYDIFAVFSLLTPMILARILYHMERDRGGLYYSPPVPTSSYAAPQAQEAPAATCPSCGTALRAENRFCPYCGGRVAE